MIIPLLKRILKEDLARQGQLPPWIDALLSPLNEFIDRITTSLRGNLTFSDNFSGKFLTINLTHAVETIVASGAKVKVVGVLPLYFSDLQMESFGWTRKSDNSVGLTIKFVGGSSTTKADCSFQILYG